ALAAADLALSRAGASVLGEYPLFGLPAILVPYPHAWRYQRLNAAYLERQGAALVLDEDRLMTDLVSVVTSLLRSPERLETMRTSVAALARPDAAATIARLLVALAGKEGRP
ncbi:MAG: UDP-N-acetylglucosamine--N-acetylmuramyl-(pentapeptide) pyrophosphoryl-undecaprenol N-acetylglucosamine transferase, partial [Anaerolineales bacterium]|nr:UDP-N-acetylglucosamine--N-acetylmuramyl-(pentapeptide) pyrophosphoryl-undecaprenol N-acetylglucosamine transferase [Anaerolineales bacterium]